jgi:hypothetical protein
MQKDSIERSRVKKSPTEHSLHPGPHKGAYMQFFSCFVLCSLHYLPTNTQFLALSPLSMRTWQALFSFLLLNNKQTNKKEGERKISKTKTNPKKKSQKHDMQNQTRNTQQTTQTYTAQHNTTNKSVIATRCNDCQTRLDNTQNVCKNATNNKIMLIA